MLLHITTLTKERFRMNTVDEFSGADAIIVRTMAARDEMDPLLNWGMKLFYFDGKKCIQLVNFASKFTLFLFDISVRDIRNLDNIFANYMLKMFEDDPQMQHCLQQLFKEDCFLAATRITNKSIIATLNHNYTDFALSGDRFWDYIQDGMLHSLRINHDMNFNHLVSHKSAGKPDFYFPGEYFRELLIARYGSALPHRAPPFMH